MVTADGRQAPHDEQSSLIDLFVCSWLTGRFFALGRNFFRLSMILEKPTNSKSIFCTVRPPRELTTGLRSQFLRKAHRPPLKTFEKPSQQKNPSRDFQRTKAGVLFLKTPNLSDEMSGNFLEESPPKVPMEPVRESKRVPRTLKTFENPSQ